MAFCRRQRGQRECCGPGCLLGRLAGSGWTGVLWSAAGWSGWSSHLYVLAPGASLPISQVMSPP